MFIIVAYFLGVITPFFICKSSKEILCFLEKKQECNEKEKSKAIIQEDIKASNLTSDIINEWQNGTMKGGNDDE